MLSVCITKLEDAGKFWCRPKSMGDDDDSYLDYLANLNTYYERNKPDGYIYSPELGQLCACYTSCGESPHKLWYRGQVLNLFQSTAGFIAKILLIDEGEHVHIPKARMRRLDEKFKIFPHQFMQCVLNDLVPITLGSNFDLDCTLQKTHRWDSAATTFMQNLIKDAQASIEIISTNNEGIKHVVLHLHKENGNICVNNLLIKENFATLTTVDDLTLREQRVLNESKQLEASAKQPSLSDQASVRPKTNEYSPSNIYGIAQSRGNVLPNTKKTIENYKRLERQKEKEEQEKKITEFSNNQCKELLMLLSNRNDVITTPPKYKESSGTSDLSDMETTPAPKMITNRNNTSKMLANVLGKESSDLLAKISGIPCLDESDLSNKATKRVSFSPHNQVLAYNDQQETLKPAKLFNFVDSSNCGDENYSGLREANAVLRGLSIDTSPHQNNAAKKYIITDDDVLVYGKLKRNPFSLQDLDLSPTLLTSLSNFKFKTPTSFQKHIWSAVSSSLRHVVGIPEANCSIILKVIAYFLPILKNLIGLDVGKGNGPVAMICVSGWSEAQEVYNICYKLTEYYRKSCRVDIVYSGMDRVEERNVRLINGCEILIITLPALNKALDGGFTNLNRLVHLVFDNVDTLVETFTEEIKIFMRTYAGALQKAGKTESSQQIIAVGLKWSYGIQSLMNSYLTHPLVVIANKIEAALLVKVPIVVELCNSSDRLDHLTAFLETDAVNSNTIILMNSAKGADDLQQNLLQYSISPHVITEFTSPLDRKDIKAAWNAALKSKNNILIISDNAVLGANIKNASYLVHYDYPQKKSHFGNRLGCLLDTIRENEQKETPTELLSHVFVTEKNNGMRYSTGLVKLMKRGGYHISQSLKTMALSSRELKEEQKKYYDLCPRLKLFGHCMFLDDCEERHTVFPKIDLLGLCPSTGFIKVIILEVISASNFWGRIVEHRLPLDPDGSPYDTSIYLKIALDIQLYYSNAGARKRCCMAEKFDICVMKLEHSGYERVRIENVLEKDLERPKKLEVFGVDSGFTKEVMFDDLLICAEQFLKIPHQAVEIIVCCVQPPDNGDSWTMEASQTMENNITGKTLEGRVQFSLQNTVWVDPLVEKEVLTGLQTKTYTLDIGRDLLYLGFADKNFKHVENLRKLLYDVQGYPMEQAKQSNLPLSMIEHESAYLQDEGYEDVYVSAVIHPGLFFVQKIENTDMLDKLDDKIDATMIVTKADPELFARTLPVGYICVAEFSIDKKWYRGQIVDVKDDEYDIFFVDHGDREWRSKSKVQRAWPDILSQPFQAIECSFKNIVPTGYEWCSEDGDKFWDVVKDKLLSAKVNSTAASTYIRDTLVYKIELYDTTGTQTINISHELVYMGVAQGSAQCLLEMFPHSSINNSEVYKDECDRCPDLCLEIHQQQDMQLKLEKIYELRSIIFSVINHDILAENGSTQSICRLLALSKQDEIQEILILCLLEICKNNERNRDIVYDGDGLKVLCDILKKTTNEDLQRCVVMILTCFAKDQRCHVIERELLVSLCKILQGTHNLDLLIAVLEAITLICKDNEPCCAIVRQENCLEVLCELFDKSNDAKFLQMCASVFHVLLASIRNQDRIREIGGLQILSSLSKTINEQMLKSLLYALKLCVDGSELNRDYLHKIKAHINLKRCSTLPLRYSAMVKILFNDLINRITPAPITNFIQEDDEEVSRPPVEIITAVPLPRSHINESISEIVKQVTPKTAWSQRRNTVTLSVCLRGVQHEETNIESRRLKFRTVMNHVEYLLDIHLYEEICAKESRVLTKGGEVLIVLRKQKLGEIWPRLIKSFEKVPCITIDFDRWVDEYPESDVDEEDDEGPVRFKRGLPPPPPCTSYEKGEKPTGDLSRFNDRITTSSDDENSSDPGAHMPEQHMDYFNI